MKKKGTVYVVVRHTRAGDKRVGVLDDREDAMHYAEGVASSAARDYGHGRASVFRATLTLTSKALKPSAARQERP